MTMNIQQQGITLVEVMVSLLLLAIAILGFSSMQMVAIQSTDESMMRTRALTVIRGGSEALRANIKAKSDFKSAMQSTTAVTDAELKKCMSTDSTEPVACTFKEMATRDAKAVKRFAADNDLSISLETCPTASTGVTRECFIASWEDTIPAFSKEAKACAQEDGVYNVGAKCFVMEAY